MHIPRRHLNYANVVATLALVFAMSGGAMAAKHYLINSTKQINPKVLKKLTNNTAADTKLFNKLATTATVAKANFANAAGSATTAGSAATATNATNATNAANATHATTADSAPLPNTLPSGATIRGDYYIDNEAGKVGEFASDSISFVFPLSAAPTGHVILLGSTPPSQCPGTVTNPKALPGNLCIYEGDESNRGSLDFRDETGAKGKDGATNAFGVGVWETSAAVGESISGGTWAVTGS